jgi:hypothetical protein
MLSPLSFDILSIFLYLSSGTGVPFPVPHCVFTIPSAITTFNESESIGNMVSEKSIKKTAS